jgi:beta-galactosidase/beta-glucuronidase
MAARAAAPFGLTQTRTPLVPYHQPMDLQCGGPSAPYPRPQLVRRQWSSLDGWWDFAFDDADAGLAEGWQDGRPLGSTIRVPFPYQSAASGIGTLDVHEIVWYSRSFEVPSEWRFEELLLHFGAVDYSAQLWLNGVMIGRNKGGHVPFSIDIAPCLQPGQNRLTLRVVDSQDPAQPRGKQSSTGKPVRIYYACTTGIWQSVWLEPVPAVRIDYLHVRTATPEGAIALDVVLHGPFGNWSAEIDVLAGLESEQLVCQARGTSSRAHVSLRAAIPAPLPWSPQAPNLYKLRVRLYRDGTLVDSVESYVGLREFDLKDGFFYLNGERTFLLMVLDQGYWPDTLLAAPSDAALRADVEWVKRLGFNGARKHQKIENERWLYWCDRLGLLVWEEMPNARTWTPDAEDSLLAEWGRAIVRDRNHPCVVAWLPVVESLGFPALKSHPVQQALVKKLVAHTRALDPSRPVIDNDGWEHSDLTDICTIHDYSWPADKLAARYADTLSSGQPPARGWYKDKPLFLKNARYRGQPIVLSEVGGFLTAPVQAAGMRRDRLYDFYATAGSGQELEENYRALMVALGALPFLAGVCYTQLTDIAHETNGLLTADRQPKLPPEKISALNRQLLRARRRLP